MAHNPHDFTAFEDVYRDGGRRAGTDAAPGWRNAGAGLAAALEAERCRWFLWVPVFVAVGALGYFALADEPSSAAAAGLLVAALVLRLLTGGTAGTFAAVSTGMLICVAVGFSAAKLRTEIVAAPVLEPSESPRSVAGFVELVEARDGGGRRLTIRPTRIGEATEGLPRRVRISLRAELIPPELRGRLAPGDAIRAVAHIGPPSRPAIPGGYDFSRYAYYRQLGGVGYAVEPLARAEIAAPPPMLLRMENAVAQVRQAIGTRVEQALPGQNGAIAKALITGDRSSIADETNEAYRASGLFHILSISGLHMAIMGGAVFFAVRFLLALFPSLALRYPIKKWAALAAIVGAFGYLMISGGSYATLRSFLMIAVFFAAILADRPAIAMRNVALSALVLLLLFPESAIDPGFQMSFAAVTALVAGYEAFAARTEPLLAGPPSWVWRGLGFIAGIIGSTLLASVAVAPLGVYHFHQTQHFAVIANLAAVPICNLIVMPAALATLVLMPLGLEFAPLWVMGQGLEAMGAVAHWVAGLHGAVSFVPAIPVASLALMIAGGLWLCLMRRRWRYAGIVGVLAGLSLAPMAQAPDILVGVEGRLVAVRGDDGRLAGLVPRSGMFELSRWLAYVGDNREPEEVGPESAFVCDTVGCVANVGGTMLAVAFQAAAFEADCQRADILVSGRPPPAPCPKPRLVIDRRTVEGHGTHAIRVMPSGAFEVETVAEHQGRRPWSMAPLAASSADEDE